MEWKTRTLEELFAETPSHRSGTNKDVVMVNTEEAKLLAVVPGVQISSGSENLERNTQRYEIDGKNYFWLAGYPSGRWDDSFPYENIPSRLAEVLCVAEAIGN